MALLMRRWNATASASYARLVRNVRTALFVLVLLAFAMLVAWASSRAVARLPELPPRAVASSLHQPANVLANANAGQGMVPDARFAIGKKLFFDASLSEPPGTSCASCHMPEHAYSSVNGSENGVPRGSRQGHFARRTAPSLMYLRFVPRFHLEWEDEAEVPEAHGGFFWDGRVSSLAELVRQPLLNPDEMANPSFDVIAKKVEHAAYANELRAEFDAPFVTTESTIEAIGFCFEQFLTSRALSPFSSRYDDYVRGQGKLSQLEQRGLGLFKDLEKGACASCHRLDDTSAEPERSLFTDFGFDIVAAPRNRKLALSAQSFDLGLCERKDPKKHTEDPWFCGAFRTPSLRNVALRQSYFHNGTFSSLRDVVRFYAQRGTNPEAFYPHGSFDDLPEKYWDNVNTLIPPYNLRKGEPPTLDDAEIDALIAFLDTLTDQVIPPGQ
jgi:cytochrome c peroxidase